VQTYARCALPARRTRTRWRFGSKRRFVATIEWLRWLPKPGFLPQIAQTLDIARQGSEQSLHVAGLVGNYAKPEAKGSAQRGLAAGFPAPRRAEGARRGG